MLDLNCSQTNMREQTIQANCSNESGFAFFFQQMNISYLNNVKCKSVTETLQFANNSRVCFKKKDGTKIILYLLVYSSIYRGFYALIFVFTIFGHIWWFSEVFQSAIRQALCFKKSSTIAKFYLNLSIILQVTSQSLVCGTWFHH